MGFIKPVSGGVILELKVKPGSHHFFLHSDGLIEVKSAPENNKANMEIVKELKRLFGKEVSLVSGFKSRRKVVLVKGACPAGLENIIKL
jgi:uncharacterized protein (TIGR00251 family)